MDPKYVENALVFKAFCDENRLWIIDMLCEGEKCACKLLESMDISQSTLSHHMKILCEAGIVDSRPDGKWTRYSIHPDGIRRAKDLLNSVVAPEPADSPDPCGCEEHDMTERKNTL